MSGEEVDIDSLGIKALKEFITEAGLSTADCIDKNDLRARAREAAAAKASAPPVSSSSAESASSSSRKTMKIGVYECIVQGPPELINGGGGPPADVLILGLHGLGASNTDLVDLPKILGQLEPSIGSARRVEVYPQAPMTSVGSAWWQLDLMGFMQVGPRISSHSPHLFPLSASLPTLRIASHSPHRFQDSPHLFPILSCLEAPCRFSFGPRLPSLLLF